jgi:hypothetical protein
MSARQLYDLTTVDDTFYGIFSASNADNGTLASYLSVTFQRDFIGTPGTGSFQLTNLAGSPVNFGAAYARLAWYCPSWLGGAASATDITGMKCDTELPAYAETPTLPLRRVTVYTKSARAPPYMLVRKVSSIAIVMSGRRAHSSGPQPFMLLL